MRSRFSERAELAEKNLKNIEDELQLVGENMKQLELSAEKAVEREEKLKDKILQIQYKYKTAEGRYGASLLSLLKGTVASDGFFDHITVSKD
jgi:hypothetical protein